MRTTIVILTGLLLSGGLCAAGGQKDAVLADALGEYSGWRKVNAAPLTGDDFGILGRAHEGTAGTREVYVNAIGEKVSFAETGFPYPEGTILIKEAYPGAGEKPSGLTVMIKRGAGYDPENGDWEYANVTARGKVKAQGRIAACIACHAAAVATDWVFTDRR